MGVLDYVLAGVGLFFDSNVLFSVGSIPVSLNPLMVVFGFLTGMLVGATPGLAGPMAMAVSLPILISVFGYSANALLPVLGFLIGIMKGATVGGAVPAILFNIPGTPDAFLTTLDGYPMARRGEGRKALRIAHFASVSGDTLSDLVLFVCAPFLAIFVEHYLDLPEKAALILLSMAFIAAVVGSSPIKGLLSASIGMFAASIGTGEDLYPRLTGGAEVLAPGFSVVVVIIGMLIIGEVFATLEDLWLKGRETRRPPTGNGGGDGRLGWPLIGRLAPTIARSAAIGTVIGALPGVGSTLAATLGYAAGARAHARRRIPGEREFGDGAPEGVAATEAANSSVSGANLIPVLSLGIPGNAAAVFIILAADSIGGFNPGPSVFKFTSDAVNPELVLAFGLFTAMSMGNLINWTVGGAIMRSMSLMVRIPKHILMPTVLLVTLTAVYVQDPHMATILFALAFGFLGYLFRRLDISTLPFVIAFILTGNLETYSRQAYSATGGDPFFLVSSPLAAVFTVSAIGIVVLLSRRRTSKPRRAPVAAEPRGPTSV